MKSLMLLLRCVLEDFENRCSTSTSRDLKTITRRVEHEGLSFLTITLANFGSDFQKSLDRGFVGRDLFTGFQWQAGLPRFLGGFLDRVFDRGTGRLLSDPDIDAIFAVRQITLMWAKIEIDCSEERKNLAIKGYIQCEKEMHEFDRKLTCDPEHGTHADATRRQLAEFQRAATHLFGSTLFNIQRDLVAGSSLEVGRGAKLPVPGRDRPNGAEDVAEQGFGSSEPNLIRPSHGPGATADSLRGNQKYRQTEWTWRLENGGFPLADFLAPNHRHLPVIDANVRLLEPGEERPVKVVLVPKTLKTPRVIAEEPTCMQYTQQALKRELYRRLEQDSYPARGMIGFTDQEPNRNLAREASSRGHLATLDLSEASDRVSNQLVRLLFSNTPQLASAVDACRSRKADVPGHGVIRLAKFASMGSALTFPVEAMVFLTVVFVGIGRALSRPVTPSLVYQHRGRVRIYGDDIIIPVEYVDSVVQALSDFGQKVNLGKSFWTGKFRESCGGDFYDGWDVTPVRVRRLLPEQRKDAREVESAVSLRNQLYKAGLWKAARYLDDYIERLIPFPVVAETSPVLGRYSHLVAYETGRMHETLHRPEVYGAVRVNRIPVDELDGIPALLKVMLHPSDGEEPQLAEDHLERSGRPELVRIKLRWAQPF